jgi:hypothetical protein
VLQGAAGEAGALVHPAEAASVPGAVAADAYQQTVGFARGSDGPLLDSPILGIGKPGARTFWYEAQEPPTNRAAAFLSRSRVI